MKKVMQAIGYMQMETFDQVFLFDDPKNNCNILGATFIESFSFEEMKNYLIEKTEKLPKCRSKIVSKFGFFWYAPMS